MFDTTVIGPGLTQITTQIAPYVAVIGLGAVVSMAGMLLKKLARAAR